MQAFALTPADRAVGAKLQPFPELDFRVGTSLARGGTDSLLSSTTQWEASWSREWAGWGGLSAGLSTTGAVNNLHSGYSQALNGVIGIPLEVPLKHLHTELRLSPSMTLDMLDKAVGAGFLSEIMGQTVLSSRRSPYKSTLNVKLGYHLAPEARPVASARLELRITPNL